MTDISPVTADCLALSLNSTPLQLHWTRGENFSPLGELPTLQLDPPLEEQGHSLSEERLIPVISEPETNLVRH